jgi:phosphatidylserine/phosphatidylglycerophosphate/cardiolipin synthase-like enzyme
LAAGWGSSGCTLITDLIGSEKRDVYKFDHPFTVEEPSFRRSVEALGNPMVGGNKAELLKNGDEIFPAMTRDIRAAKRSVNLETYIFQPDEAGRQFANAMIDAAKKGVEVRFLIDSWGSKLGDLEQPLKDAGVRVRKYRPVRLFSIWTAALRQRWRRCSRRTRSAAKRSLIGIGRSEGSPSVWRRSSSGSGSRITRRSRESIVDR